MRSGTNLLKASASVARTCIITHLGEAPSDSPFTEESHERVVKELFSDAIDLGMVSLPPLYGLDSFEFKAVKNHYFRGRIPLYSKVEVSLRNRLPANSVGGNLTGDTEVVTVPIKFLFTAEMDDACVPSFIERMKIALDYLLSPAEQV